MLSKCQKFWFIVIKWAKDGNLNRANMCKSQVNVYCSSIFRFLPLYVSWIKWISQYHYAYEALMINQWASIGTFASIRQKTQNGFYILYL